MKFIFCASFLLVFSTGCSWTNKMVKKKSDKRPNSKLSYVTGYGIGQKAGKDFINKEEQNLFLVGVYQGLKGKESAWDLTADLQKQQEEKQEQLQAEVQKQLTELLEEQQSQAQEETAGMLPSVESDVQADAPAGGVVQPAVAQPAVAQLADQQPPVTGDTGERVPPPASGEAKAPAQVQQRETAGKPIQAKAPAGGQAKTAQPAKAVQANTKPQANKPGQAKAVQANTKPQANKPGQAKAVQANNKPAQTNKPGQAKAVQANTKPQANKPGQAKAVQANTKPQANKPGQAKAVQANTKPQANKPGQAKPAQAKAVTTEKQSKPNTLTGGNMAERGKKFLEENGKKPGVTTTASGLQYEVIKAGTGKSPSATDKVEVHYRGTLIDGKEFDSSYRRKATITFPLNGVIKGWTEGLQLMKEGGKSKFYIPSSLAYGSKGAPPNIPPDAVLIFEVELIKVVL